MGREIDVLIEKCSGADVGKQYYLYCIVGDTKEHTGAGTYNYDNGNSQMVNGQGIYQTGISVQTGTGVIADGNASIIEFMVSEGNQSFSQELYKYKLVEIIVY